MHVSKFRLLVAGILMAVSFATLGAGAAYAFQEHMFSARNDLQQAVNELQQAEDDKGGHRVAAINLAQQAIEQVNLGIQYGADHLPPPPPGPPGPPPPPPWAPPPPGI
jgi:hypothetical protein